MELDIYKFEKDIKDPKFSELLLNYFTEAACILQMCFDFIDSQKEKESEG